MIVFCGGCVSKPLRPKANDIPRHELRLINTFWQSTSRYLYSLRPYRPEPHDKKIFCHWHLNPTSFIIMCVCLRPCCKRSYLSRDCGGTLFLVPTYSSSSTRFYSLVTKSLSSLPRLVWHHWSQPQSMVEKARVAARVRWFPGYW